MYVLTNADLVWNRALFDDPGTGVGDRYLRAMAKPYGRIMGSGVSAVMDTSSPEEVQQAADAFEYLGLSDLADLTRRLVDADWWSEDDLEDRLNRAFWGLEDALHGAFERKYAESPGGLRRGRRRRSRSAAWIVAVRRRPGQGSLCGRADRA